MEQQKRAKRIKCVKCNEVFDDSEIRLMQRIVTKKNTAAVRYYFVCPKCLHEYVCYYKDAKINTMFKQGKIEDARKRMRWLKRYFNDTSV